MHIFQIIVLALSGLLLTMVGSMRISNPIKNYEKNSGIKVASDVNLLNELKGTSAVMLFAGLIILSGIFLSELTYSSHVVAVLIFLGFAAGRILSAKVDGKPNKLIINGLIFELVLGGLNLALLIMI